MTDIFVENDDIEKKIEEHPKENLSLKYSIVDLPSEGKLGYPSTIEYRDILVRDEKEISSATEKTFSKILNNVLKSLFKDQSFFDELTIYDRDFLLLWIWANNYSTIKKIETTCPHCETNNNYEIDLTALEVKSINDEFQNPYKFTTSSDEKVNFRLLTIQDETVAFNFCKNNKEYEEYFVMLCLSIDFKLKLPLKEKLTKIENEFTGRDMSILRGFHSHFKYGIEDTVKRECKGCGEVSSIPIPFQVDFFIPTLSDNFKKAV